MPTLSKPQLFERESPWRRESDRFLQELCRKGVPILARLNYYAERDLPVPEADQLEVLVQDEEIELKRIAGALTFAAEASEELADAIVTPTLEGQRLLQSLRGKGPENAGGVPMPQIRCSRSIWAKSTDKVASGSPVIVIPKCATGSWSLLSRDLFAIFLASYFRHCKRTFGNGGSRP